MSWKVATSKVFEEEEQAKIRRKLRKEFDSFDQKILEWYREFNLALNHNLEWAELAIATDRVYFPKDHDEENFIMPILKIEDKGKVQWHLIYKINCRKNFEGEMSVFFEGVPLYPEKYKDLLKMEIEMKSFKLREWQDQF